MLNILFWNLGRRSSTDAVVSIAREHSADILLLAESEFSRESLVTALNENQDSLFFLDRGFSNRVQIYTRYMDDFFRPLQDHGGIAVRHISPPVGKDVILVAVHLQSKLFSQEEDQSFACCNLNEIIKNNEKKVGHSRTILMGDLNLNPFESGVAYASGLNAVSDRRIARKGTRTIDGKRYRYFYNPMWNFFGDFSTRPPGTYFYDSGKCANYYWHVFDQVLIRPDLIDYFEFDSLKIITEVNGFSLLTDQGKPDRHKGSDHLPIILSLNL